MKFEVNSDHWSDENAPHVPSYLKPGSGQFTFTFHKTIMIHVYADLCFPSTYTHFFKNWTNFIQCNTKSNLVRKYCCLPIWPVKFSNCCLFWASCFWEKSAKPIKKKKRYLKTNTYNLMFYIHWIDSKINLLCFKMISISVWLEIVSRCSIPGIVWTWFLTSVGIFFTTFSVPT